MIFTFVLMVLAGGIAYGLAKREDVWPVICLYWFVLTVKYAVELWSL